ncbi:hypothetical protein D3C72_2380620 [compost metagenome]
MLRHPFTGHGLDGPFQFAIEALGLGRGVDGRQRVGLAFGARHHLAERVGDFADFGGGDLFLCTFAQAVIALRGRDGHQHDQPCT